MRPRVWLWLLLLLDNILKGVQHMRTWSCDFIICWFLSPSIWWCSINSLYCVGTWMVFSMWSETEEWIVEQIVDRHLSRHSITIRMRQHVNWTKIDWVINTSVSWGLVPILWYYDHCTCWMVPPLRELSKLTWYCPTVEKLQKFYGHKVISSLSWTRRNLYWLLLIWICVIIFLYGPYNKYVKSKFHANGAAISYN